MYSTRPDITYSVSILRKYTCNLGKECWKALVSILSYLKGTLDYELHFLQYLAVIKGYSDPTCNSDREDFMAVIAWIFTLGCTVIC